MLKTCLYIELSFCVAVRRSASVDCNIIRERIKMYNLYETNLGEPKKSPIQTFYTWNLLNNGQTFSDRVRPVFREV